uniref:Uncharacterized protein n=1 Tax=Arundo donax TaxID=35708 RepID=A0A0A9G2K2_ARUDO
MPLDRASCNVSGPNSRRRQEAATFSSACDSAALQIRSCRKEGQGMDDGSTRGEEED